MIHFTKEGHFKKIGLNLYRAPGGFVASWMWYTPSLHEVHGWRFRFRWHIKPRFIWSVDRTNVIDNYLLQHGFELVNREELVDLKKIDQN